MSTSALRDSLAGLLGLHLSLVSQATNEDMRVLTVIATVFIPLTFIAGVYGMNFDILPGMHDRQGFGILCLVMFLICGGLWATFRRSHWL
mgnify:CR=1 FL=1